MNIATSFVTDSELKRFIERHEKLFVLTGAGCSTESGIPDYRDKDGAWKRPQPVQFLPFMQKPAVRQRYWARSFVGWRYFSTARPNDTHHALARLEEQDRIELLVTQNVDGLHSAAGSKRVVDLHGRLDVVRCMGCDHTMPRVDFQALLQICNPTWTHIQAHQAPDGDVDLESLNFSTFDVPPCPLCSGILKPNVVFFGESVPKLRVQAAMNGVQAADAMLIVGSSLMVYSGYRFAEAAAAAGKPIAALNLGRTRADELLTLKISERCSDALKFLLPSFA